MGGNGGGGGRSGRGGGGGGETLEETIARSYRELGMTPPSEMSKAERDASNRRNLESSRQNDIMEGGKSFENPSVYKSNAPPKYNPTPAPKKETKTETKRYKVGDIVSNARGRFRFNKYGVWDRV